MVSASRLPGGNNLMGRVGCCSPAVEGAEQDFRCEAGKRSRLGGVQ